MDFETWWHEIGSGILPLPGSDMEEHGKRVAGEAWDAAIKGFLEAWEHGKDGRRKKLVRIDCLQRRSLFSISAPCSDGTVEPCQCKQCLHANAIERPVSTTTKYERAIHWKPIR